MPRLIRRMVRAWLDQEDAEHLHRMATSRNIEVHTLIEQILRPYLDARPDEAVWPIVLDTQDEQRLRREITELCREDPEADIDEEVSKWLAGFVRCGISPELAL